MTSSFNVEGLREQKLRNLLRQLEPQTRAAIMDRTCKEVHRLAMADRKLKAQSLSEVVHKVFA